MDPREALLDSQGQHRRDASTASLSRAYSEAFSLRTKNCRTTLYEGLSLPSRVRKGWSRLVEQASEPNPFFEQWFLSACDSLAASDTSVQLAVVEDNDGLVGLLPLCQARDYGRLSIGHVENWLHDNMFLGVPLIRHGKEEQFWSALIATLDADPWARGFLHLRSITEDGPVHRGLQTAAAKLGRKCPTVFRRLRPMLTTELSAQDYLQQYLKKKRRSEFKRLRRRLGEQGELVTRQLRRAAQVEPWCDEFLALEEAGWKGDAGSALNCRTDAQQFFRKAMAAAFAADRLHFLRLDLDGRPIAMLTSLRAPPGAFGFKSCFDQDFGRYSPGILLQIDNLELQSDPDISWQDSCAMPGHPVGALWSDERSVVHVTLPLSGWRRRLIHSGVRAIDEGCRKIGALRARSAKPQSRHGEDAAR